MSKDSPVPPETVFIWSHPRALSTALLRSLAELPDAVTVLEPFMVPWQVDMGVYRGCESRQPNYKEAINNLLSDVMEVLKARETDEFVEKLKKIPAEHHNKLHYILQWGLCCVQRQDEAV